MPTTILRLIIGFCLHASLVCVQAGSALQQPAGQLANQAPIAKFSADCNGLKCQLNAAASTDPDGTIVHYQWRIGSGALSTAMDFRYAFHRAGRYQLELTVTDNQRQKASCQRTIVLSDPRSYPIAPDQPIQHLSGVQGQVLSYRLHTTQPHQRVTITAQGGHGQLQLAARFTRPPTAQQADCRQQRRQQQASCQLLLPAPGTVYLQLQGLADFKDVTLLAHIEPDRPSHIAAQHIAQQQVPPIPVGRQHTFR